jgi:acetyl-CoA/propionyl-CoA carboxylase biotin carboxyl carrier protein
LNIEKIIDAAIATGAQAIHPGYGFLAENAAFAQACADANIVFVGPGIDALTIMGDKIAAKRHVATRDVPTVPGTEEAGLSDERLAAAAKSIGFPVLIKPSAGGGGKGMHLVHEQSEMLSALSTARREAASSFGDDTLLLERFIQRPRHIEVQILADGFGKTLHLGERECSLQRRHQKVIEEAPSPLLDEETRERIGLAAVETGRSVGYLGAGTVEFIVSADAPDEFFFMEMNTRLQVEHPVTEMVTGRDLVEWQLRIAAGESLSFDQSDVRLSGHAVEARIYAEDPENGFLPTGGTVHYLVEPSGDGIRVDSALVPGLTISSDYDPMLAKVIAWAPTRTEAIQRLSSALDNTVTLGVTNNVEFLKLLLSDPDVESGNLDTSLIERHLESYQFTQVDDDLLVRAAAVLHAAESRDLGTDIWRAEPGWRVGDPAASTYKIDVDGRTETVSVFGRPDDATVTLGTQSYRAITALTGNHARVRINELSSTFFFSQVGTRLYLASAGVAWAFDEISFHRSDSIAANLNPELRSPMPGSVVAIFVADGDEVEAEMPVVSIEAMKMEHVLRAPIRGVVSLDVEIGSQVTGDQVVATIAAVLEKEAAPAKKEKTS